MQGLCGFCRCFSQLLFVAFPQLLAVNVTESLYGCWVVVFSRLHSRKQATTFYYTPRLKQTSTNSPGVQVPPGNHTSGSLSSSRCSGRGACLLSHRRKQKQALPLQDRERLVSALSPSSQMALLGPSTHTLRAHVLQCRADTSRDAGAGAPVPSVEPPLDTPARRHKKKQSHKHHKHPSSKAHKDAHLTHTVCDTHKPRALHTRTAALHAQTSRIDCLRWYGACTRHATSFPPSRASTLQSLTYTTGLATPPSQAHDAANKLSRYAHTPRLVNLTPLLHPPIHHPSLLPRTAQYATPCKNNLREHHTESHTGSHRTRSRT